LRSDKAGWLWLRFADAAQACPACGSFDFVYLHQVLGHLAGLLARAGFAVFARLDAPELDQAGTEGVPLRLRPVARRTAVPPLLTTAPLAPALTALARYTRRHELLRARALAMLPVRVQGAILQRQRERELRLRRRKTLEAPVIAQR
jgi:hypothetical protein